MTMTAQAPSGNTWTRQITADGAFARQPTGFRTEIGDGPDALHPAEPGRYHLYDSLACPWAHRTLIVRALKGLEQVVSVDGEHPHLTDKGWSFDTDFRGATGDTVGARALNGVYRSGFARSQQADDAAVERLFAALDRVEALLARQDFLCGDVLTEADVRLFVTLIRFDAVYHTHFKCNRRTVLQSPALVRYMADIHRLPGVAATVDLDHVWHHYDGSHRHINSSGLIPQGPDMLAALARHREGRP